MSLSTVFGAIVLSINYSMLFMTVLVILDIDSIVFFIKYTLPFFSLIKNLSLYQDYYRQKQYDESLKYWKNVFTYCPKVSKGIYIKGARLYEKKIKISCREILKNK